MWRFVAKGWPQQGAQPIVGPMFHTNEVRPMNPNLPTAVAIHLTCALAALLLGPLVLWTRLGVTPRPLLHRSLGGVWVVLMLATALSALFIRHTDWPLSLGFTPLHLLVPVTLWGLISAFRYLAHGNVRGHRAAMQGVYLGACVGAGVFTLLPQRLLGQWVWGQWLGWI